MQIDITPSLDGMWKKRWRKIVITLQVDFAKNNVVNVTEMMK